MLVSREDVLNVLRCPISGEKLEKGPGNKLQVPGNNLIDYDLIDDYPILVDFEDSILSIDQIENMKISSLVKREKYSGVFSILRKISSKTNKIVFDNVSYVRELIVKDEANVLIIGGGTIGHGMNYFYESPKVKLISFDVFASDYTQFIADAHKIPLPDEYFDCVIIQAVLEHVLNPVKVVSEIYRVLKKEGLVYSEVPFLQQVHEGAYDFTRFTESGHRYLFKHFEKIKSGVLLGPGTQLLWSIEYFFRSIFRSRVIGKAFRLLFFWIQFFDKIISNEYAIDNASGTFFLGRKINKVMSCEEIIKHYQGSQ